MKKKIIVANVVLSAVFHAAFFAFLFFLRTSSPIPDTDASVVFVSLISPQATMPQTPQETPPQPQEKKPREPRPQPKPPQNPDAPTIPMPETPPQEEPQETSESAQSTSDLSESSHTADQTQGSETGESFARQTAAESAATTSPRPIYMPQIPYPRVAKNAKIEGTAEIAYTIDSTGRVIGVEILSVPHPSFESVIKRSVMSWRFSPATKDARPVQVKANMTVVFKLEE